MRFFINSFVCTILFIGANSHSQAQSLDVSDFCSGSTIDISKNIPNLTEKRFTWRISGTNNNISGATENRSGTPTDNVIQKLTITTNSSQSITYSITNTPISGAAQTYTYEKLRMKDLPLAEKIWDIYKEQNNNLRISNQR